MSRYQGKLADSQQPARTGVLLVNLGTPEQPTTPALRTYLKEFLSDPRVVEIPRLIWLCILYCFILPFRPKNSAKLYQGIWTEQGSPLMQISLAQGDAVAKQLAQAHGDKVIVKVAMRYGNPSIADKLIEMREQGVNKLVVLPLYPQYAGPTTGSVFDAVTQEIAKWRWVPSLHFIGSYHDNTDYIDALAASIEEDFAANGKPQKLVLSYHGMPKAFHNWGDPYFDYCHRTTELLSEKLGLSSDEFQLTFQSRFGKAEWLKPYTDETLENLPKQGVKDVAIISPAFSADCLETLEELEEENREVFEQAGGEKYRYIPCLNDRDDHIAMMVKLVSAHI